MKMKKSIFAVILVFTIGVFVNTVVFANDVNVTVNAQPVDFPDGQGAVITDGRTLVPIRGVFEMLGFDVDWDSDTSTAIITSEDYDLRIPIGSDTFTMNGTSYNLDVPACIIEGRTMVPIRLPLESVGFQVGWESNTVLITNANVLVVNINAANSTFSFLDLATNSTITYTGFYLNGREVIDTNLFLDANNRFNALLVDYGMGDALFMFMDGDNVHYTLSNGTLNIWARRGLLSDNANS